VGVEGIGAGAHCDGFWVLWMIEFCGEVVEGKLWVRSAEGCEEGEIEAI
jgi:hypothetical protein